MADNHLAIERPFELAIEASPGGILLVDASGRIVLVNRELERQLGYDRDELVGQSVERVVPPSVTAAHAAPRQQPAGVVGPGPLGAGGNLSARCKDGSEISLEVAVSPVHTDCGEFVLASVSNITERRRLEAEYQVALEERRTFERFVADVSGQFVNLPLERMDATIREALGRASASFAIDRCIFYELANQHALIDVVSWDRIDGPRLPGPAPTRDRFPWTFGQCLSGQVVLFSSVAELPEPIERDAYRAAGVRSGLVVPLAVEGLAAGAVGFYAVREERAWPPDVVRRLSVIATVFGHVLARRRSDAAQREALEDGERLKRNLEIENVQLKTEARPWLAPTLVVGESDAVRRVTEQIQRVAATDSTVLLVGETGTGKEFFATQIHELGPRRRRAMVRTNCAAIPSTLIESELFGREKGAFTGALARQLGRFELADGSTIFLDEIGDLPADVQVKLLRVLEEGQIERLGSPEAVSVDARIIAATHCNLEQRVAEGTFREDLYYRLNVFPIRVPPLRERLEDIPLLAWRFVDEFSKAFGKRIDEIAPESLAALRRHTWPGNIRELRNVIERAMITATVPRLTVAPPQITRAVASHSPRLIDVEREHIRGVLESTGWRIRGAGGAADKLGLKPTTLETRLQKLGLKRPAAHLR